MKKTIAMLAVILASAFAQKTLFTQPIGEDTLRIKADACLWTRGWYYHGITTHDSTWYLSEDTTTYDSTWTTTQDENTFGRAYGFIGATVQYGKWAYARYYYDLGEINGKPAYDLIVGVSCCNFDFRFGQLKPPNGYEVAAAPWKTDFIENSALAGCRTPTGATRDIGAMLTYNWKFAQPSVGVINGNGRNMVKDNNPFLDMAFRLPITPLGKPNLTIAGNGYYGNDTFARKDQPRPFMRIGAEALWIQPSYFVRVEYLIGNDSLGSANAYRALSGFYAAAGYRAGHFQPVLRVERLTVDGKNTSSLALGLNAFLCSDMLKPMLNVSMVNDEARKTTSTKVMFQIQGAFW